MDTDNDGVISKQEFDASGSVADVEFDDFVIQDADDIANWIWLVCKHTPSNPICTEPNKAAVNIFDVGVILRIHRLLSSLYYFI